MPYREKDGKKEYQMEYMRKKRSNKQGLTGSNKNFPDNVTKSVDSMTQMADNVTLDGDRVMKVSPTPRSEQVLKYQQLLGIERGKKLDKFVSKGNNLVKLQRACGSLGKNAEDVWLGELNLKTIGNIIGTKPGLFEK